MRHIVRHAGLVAAVVTIAAAAMAGCSGPLASDSNTVVYQDGKYQLYGDGTSRPYYWVWIPNNAPGVSPPSGPPPIPTRSVVTAQTGGRYQLFGNGTTQPYYWVWVPDGTTTTVPPPPPLPTR